MLSADAVWAALKTVPEPELGGDIVARNLVRDVRVADGHVTVTIALTTPACPFRLSLESDVQQALATLEGVQGVELRWEVDLARPATPGPLPGIVHCVGITGARAAVGRSAVTGHLAVALAQAGARAAVFDADPSGGGLGVLRTPGGYEEREGQILPAEVEGAYFVGADAFEMAATGGAGAVLGLADRLRRVAWGPVDYLLLDLPVGPAGADLIRGAGIPWTGLVMVSSPQASAAQRGLAALPAWRQAGPRVLGVIENMSFLLCPHCDKGIEMFGHAGGHRLAAAARLPLLGSIPLDEDLCRADEEGQTVLAARPQSPIAEVLRRVAANLAGRISVEVLAPGAVRGAARDGLLWPTPPPGS
jgi:ATP-binding protein involved in chromosome partitioning